MLLLVPAVTESHALLDAVLEHVGGVVRTQSKATADEKVSHFNIWLGSGSFVHMNVPVPQARKST